MFLFVLENRESFHSTLFLFYQPNPSLWPVIVAISPFWYGCSGSGIGSNWFYHQKCSIAESYCDSQFVGGSCKAKDAREGLIGCRC